MTAAPPADLATVRQTARWRRPLERAEAAALLVAVAVLTTLAVASVTPVGRDRLDLEADVSLTLVAAAVVYALGHLLRGLRLAVLLHDPVVGARRVLGVHLLTAGLGLLLPFKLGDLVRVRAAGALVGSTSRGVVVVVLERVLDVTVVLGLSLFAVATAGGDLGPLAPLLVVSGVFVLLSGAALTVLPAYLRTLSLYLVRRPDAPGGERLLAVLERALVVVGQAPQMLRRQAPTLLLLTAMIWVAELAALGLAVPALAEDPAQLARGLVSFLSSLSSGSVAVLPGPSLSPRYRAVLLVPLLWAAALAGLVLARRVLARVSSPRRPSW